MTSKKDRGIAYRRNIALLVAVVVLFLSFMIIRPFLIAILSAAVLSYIFYPIFLFILNNMPKAVRSREISAVLTCLIVTFMVLLPVLFISNVMIGEVKSGYVFINKFILSSQWSPESMPPIFSKWSGYLPQVKSVASDIAGQFMGALQEYLVGIPNLALSLIILVFSSYYFLKHGNYLYLYFSELVPLPKGRYKQILKRFDDISRGMLMGQVFVGVLQGVLAWLGFMLLGVPNAFLLGFLTAIISIIPLLGAAIVWFPVTIYLFIIGTMTGEYSKAIILLLYGVFVISLIDNILKPKIIGGSAKIHPLIILFGILGGIRLFGIPGILIGPVILALFDVVIEIYKETL
jgi:predicted PurR-regulated permease PerM